MALEDWLEVEVAEAGGEVVSARLDSQSSTSEQGDAHACGTESGLHVAPRLLCEEKGQR